MALAFGATSLLIASSFVRFDVLGFTLEPADFGVDGAAEPDVRIAPIGEERRLSAATVAELLHLRECRSDVGAIAEGEVSNPLESERAYLITVQFFVDGERQLDGFAEVVVPPGVTSSFSAVSASPPVDGAVECRFGDVFRFIPD